MNINTTVGQSLRLNKNSEDSRNERSNYFISNITKHRYNLSAGINDFLSYIIEEDKKNNKSAKKKD